MANTDTLADLLDQLSPDPWRQQSPFSPEVEACQRQLFDPATSREDKADALLEWLASTAQPCLFGRMAAKKGWLSVGVVTEADLFRGDDHVRQVIQEDRRTWKRAALSGERHGFIILAVSRALAYAEPGPVLQRWVLRLCELYLSQTGLNEVFHDSLALTIARAERSEYRQWKVGVNLFAAQGDGRWWHDHRIPGGVAFSMNSVGHMARRLAEDAIRVNPKLAERATQMPTEQLERWALPLAMRTIATAARGRIPGTWLLPRPGGPAGSPEAEGRRLAVLGSLAAHDEDEYGGRYHTDQTIPAEYFDPSPDRPAGLKDHGLYFTYFYCARGLLY